MKKLLLATAALVTFAFATPASAQLIVGGGQFYIQIPQVIVQPPPVIMMQPPVVVQQPQVVIQPAPQLVAPPPVVVQQQPPAVVQAPPAVVQAPPQVVPSDPVCYVYTSGANVRQWVWGPIVTQLHQGTQVFLYGQPQFAYDGVPWYQTNFGGWISMNVLDCH